ncbi:MAG: MgtC/SapB family protein, partial [Woeseiaceae bacterium]|nr:MgtC/SapB family protein [Woeseiaceae bacterium]
MNLDWSTIWINLYHLGIAYVLALPVAWDRESRSHGIGLRTFPLVSVAACGYMLVGLSVLDTTG